MKNLYLLTLALLASTLGVFAQATDSTDNQYANTADNMLLSDSKLTIGGYGEVHYNQPLDGEYGNLGKLDVHRLVMLFGYNFNDKTKFVSEVEFEHVKELYVEQAFIQHKLHEYVNFRGGLMLIPMGIINEYHEPTTFNGVERPLVDKYIAPTTWREIGAGFSGNYLPAKLKYQLYVVNGFNGYDEGAVLQASSGFRKGRQKGAESYMSSPNLATKVEYYGIGGLNLGVSGYFGNTQSTEYADTVAAVADSTVVGIAMVGLDARYQKNGLQLKGQFYHTSISNSQEYNEYTDSKLGSSMVGYYVEAGYDVFKFCDTDKKLVPFVRYEAFNTHNSVEGELEIIDSYNKHAITTGLTLSLTKNAVLKTDLQLLKSKADDSYAKTLNFGIGVMF